MLFVHECDSPVVFLLDCCHAGASVHREQSSSTVVTLAATGFHDVAPVRGKDSFTTFLTEALKRVRGNQEDVTVAYLKTLISADLNNTDKLNSRGISRRVTPDYITFSNNTVTLRVLPRRIAPIVPVAGLRIVEKPTPASEPTPLVEPLQAIEPTPGVNPMPGVEPTSDADADPEMVNQSAPQTPITIRNRPPVRPRPPVNKMRSSPRTPAYAILSLNIES